MFFLFYLLLISSGIFQASQPDFWTWPILLYLSMVLCFQLQWFYFAKKTSRQVMEILTFAAYLILFFHSRQLDFFMTFLIALNAYWKTSLNQGFIKNILGLVGIEILVFLFGQPGLLEILLPLVFWTSAHSLAKEERRRKEAQSQIYEKTIREDQLAHDREEILDQSQVLQKTRTLQERNRISRDIHDSAGHVLSTVVIQLEAISKLSEEKMPELSLMAENLRSYTKDGLEEVRKIIHQMKPGHYDRISFLEKLRLESASFEKNTGIRVFFTHNQPSFDLSPDQQETIYRAIQEFQGNTAKHAHAQEVRIHLHFTDHSLILDLKDDGQGAEKIQASMGLKAMQERVALANGRVTFSTRPGQGFHTHIVLERKSE